MKRTTLISPLIAINIILIFIFFVGFLFIDCDKKPTESTAAETVMDIDGNVYQTVKIGQQWWMAENLKVTHYSNGDTIPNIAIDNIWSSLTTGAYCCLNNNEDNVAVYGRLYNGYALLDNRNIAPQGWHVPTYEEWKELITYLGGEDEAGRKLMETGTEHWNEPNTCATNESGFTMRPGGYRFANGSYGTGNPGDSGGAWYIYSDSQFNSYRAHGMVFTSAGCCFFWEEGNCDEQCGYSIRCIKDDDDD